MELKKLFTEDKAVSPVIAVVLMIAVTVILAAVVAAFALGLGGTANQTPQATFDFDYDGANSLTATHEGGDTVRNNATLFNEANANQTSFNTPVSTGDSATINGVDLGDNARVIWRGESDQTATLAEYNVTG